MSEYSPMMQHYLDTKKEYNDCILFYRLGDFYEMFFEDARIVSKTLDLVLTKKSCGKEERAPMCGVPFHSADTYINRMVKAGYKVAICEQLEDPKTTKGMVKRDVVRIVTPSTNFAPESLDEDNNNYLLAAICGDDEFGLAFADVSTGDFYATRVQETDDFLNEYRKFSPTEIIADKSFLVKTALISDIFERDNVPLTTRDDCDIDEAYLRDVILNHFGVSSLSALSLDDSGTMAAAVGLALSYLKETQKKPLLNMQSLKVYRDDSSMLLDASTRRNLELCETMRDKEKRGSLFGVLDKTKSAMGARTLRAWIESPLTNVDSINERLDAVDELVNDLILREELREQLSGVYDLERLLTRISYQTANPKDVIAFLRTIEIIALVEESLCDVKSELLSSIKNDIDPLSDICQMIAQSIDDEPKVSLHDGDIIRTGYNDEVDRLRSARTDGKRWMLELEEKEREKTGIKNLRIKFNKVFGYYFEVTNSYTDMVPDYFIRKQTLTNAERFFTDELKDMENTILGASEKLNHLEFDLYMDILSRITDQIPRIQRQAKLLARIDVLQSLATAAYSYHYTRPVVDDSSRIEIKDGRHPVIERMLKGDSFIANDTSLNDADMRISIITGPNMAGKSTYMRQSALIVLLAQIGSFVPAKSARIGVVDRIFTRVGASDDLASGQSTFMVEMNEVSNILHYATSRSLLILDEIGRGTSTFDGLAIAWAVVEYISDPKVIGAKTLFATHYHELTELEGKIDGVKNFCIMVKENDDGIVFPRRIMPGGADKSYGIQVARLAGVPDEVTDRASEIVNDLMAHDMTGQIQRVATGEAEDDDKESYGQITLFDLNEVLPQPRRDDADMIAEEIKNIDPDNLTPMEALEKLYMLKKMVKENE